MDGVHLALVYYLVLMTGTQNHSEYSKKHQNMMSIGSIAGFLP